MTDKGFQRKLTAILSMDVKGYSRLMGDDEESTIRTITKYREIVKEQVEQHQGRVVDSPGDNILTEFTSVVNAVKCAVEIQKEIAGQNESLPENRKMEFRIGINLGDVAQEGERIYGDGVNVAARIEGLADPGGICISRSAYDQVKKKLSFGYKYLGEHSVKNIDELVRVYRVLTTPEHAGKVIGVEKGTIKKWRRVATAAVIVLVVVAVGLTAWNLYLQRSKRVEPASIEKMAYALPDKPSIAVLAFDNMSGDPEQEYFSDGISEDIITALSKNDQLFVIARNSTFTYKGKPVKIKQVAEELGVRYVLEGSVRKTEERVRITAQLIDAIEGHHLWAERYDRDIKDIFVLQDEITLKILEGLHIKLTSGEQSRMHTKQYKSLDVHLKFAELNSAFNKATEEGYIRHGQLAQEIIEMEPESPGGYSSLGWNYLIRPGQNKSREESIAMSYKLAQKALSLDESNPFTYALLSRVYLKMRQYEKAIAAGERGVSLIPNGAFNHANLTYVLIAVGKYDEALYHIKKAIRLDPFPEYWYYYQLGRCYGLKGQYEEGITAFKKSIHINPEFIGNYVLLAGLYVLLERHEEAEKAAKKALDIYPYFSVRRAEKGSVHKNPAEGKIFYDAWIKAGLPE